jgi:hypothetical protein
MLWLQVNNNNYAELITSLFSTKKYLISLHNAFLSSVENKVEFVLAILQNSFKLFNSDFKIEN